MKKSMKWVAVFMLGFALGIASLMLLPAPQADAVPEHGTWAKFYADVCERTLVGGWETDCNGNYSSWGTSTGDAEYGDLFCP